MHEFNKAERCRRGCRAGILSNNTRYFLKMVSSIAKEFDIALIYNGLRLKCFTRGSHGFQQVGGVFRTISTCLFYILIFL